MDSRRLKPPGSRGRDRRPDNNDRGPSIVQNNSTKMESHGRRSPLVGVDNGSAGIEGGLLSNRGNHPRGTRAGRRATPCRGHSTQHGREGNRVSRLGKI